MHDVLLSDIRIAPTKNLDVNNNSYVVVKGSLYWVRCIILLKVITHSNFMVSVSCGCSKISLDGGGGGSEREPISCTSSVQVRAIEYHPAECGCTAREPTALSKVAHFLENRGRA